jgi:hypothetical protein
VVIRSLGAWWVDCEGKSYGPFVDEYEAQQNAVIIAKTFGDPSRQSLVYAPDDGGKLRLIWSGDKD